MGAPHRAQNTKSLKQLLAFSALAFWGFVNTSYYKEMDYSDKIGTGTYRVGATFDADGHSITRYSNSRTF